MAYPKTTLTRAEERAAKLGAVLNAVITNGRCPICEHRLGNLRLATCHCTCHDEDGPYLDFEQAFDYLVKRGL